MFRTCRKGASHNVEDPFKVGFAQAVKVLYQQTLQLHMCLLLNKPVIRTLKINVIYSMLIGNMS